MNTLTDPVAEHDALVLMCSAVFIGCRPALQHLPEKNRAILAGALSRSFQVLGIDLHNEVLAASQIKAELRKVEARRTPIAMGESPLVLAP